MLVGREAAGCRRLDETIEINRYSVKQRSQQRVAVIFLHSGKLNLLSKFYHVFTEKAVGIHKVFHRLTTMDNSCVVTAPKMFAARLE